MINAALSRGMEDVIVDPRLQDAAVPAMNGYFDAVSLGAMYAMLAGGGQLGGVRILSEETVRKASEIQNDQRDRVIVMTMQWRLGYHRLPIANNSSPAAMAISGSVAPALLPIPGTTWPWRWCATVGRAHRSAICGFFASVRPQPAPSVLD